MLLREIASIVSHLKDYPFWLSSDVPTLTCKNGDRPIVFVHGFMSNPSIWKSFLQRFTLLGWNNLHYHYYSVFREDMQSIYTKFSYYIDDVLESYDYEVKLSFICHSLGGIVVRDWVTRGDNARWVDNVITVGSPHHGTEAARLRHLLLFLGVCNLAKDLLPESDYLKDLNSRPQPSGVSWTTIYSDKDPVVIPRESARLPVGWKGHSFILRNYGHTALVYSCYVTLLAHNVLTHGGCSGIGRTARTTAHSSK